MSEDASRSPEEGDGQSRVKAARDRLEAEADRAVEGFDDRAVELLSWILDTETRARIYVYLRQHPGSTSDEVAEGTGLYPSTVREALADLAEDGTLDRRKRQSDGAGNNPYEYTAMAPSDLVGEVVGQLQDELNRLCRMDRPDDPGEPVHIEVEGSENPNR
ncbi:MAG: winged helix-turn-helix transcriptional regulator [Halobacteriaceae archaeon]